MSGGSGRVLLAADGAGVSVQAGCCSWYVENSHSAPTYRQEGGHDARRSNKEPMMPKITPFLWFDSQAEEAMNLYTSVFKNSKVITVHRAQGRVMSVQF